MTKLKVLCVILCFTLLCACSQNAEPATTEATILPTETEATVIPTTEGDPVAEYEAPLTAVSLPIITQETTAQDGTLLSYYSYQTAAVTLPDADIAEIITLDLLNRIDASTEAGEAVHAAAQRDYQVGSAWYPYFYSVVYSATRMDQNVLSFYGTETSYDGSPRSVSASHCVNYDLTTGNALSLRSIMHEEYSADALCDLIVEALGIYEEGELFFDYADIIRERFSTNVPVDAWYFSANGLCFYFAPYEIAPNSLGTVVAQIPYEKLSGFLKDQFFPSEKLNFVGALQAQNVAADPTVLEGFAEFAELELTKGKDQVLLTVDGSVANVQIFTQAQGEGEEKHMVFATAGMGSRHGLIVEMDLSTDAPLLITYESAGATQSCTLHADAGGRPILKTK